MAWSSLQTSLTLTDNPVSKKKKKKLKVKLKKVSIIL